MYLTHIYFLLKNSAGENEKYSSTGVWNVFWTVIISYWRLLWGESQIQFHKDMECILDWSYLLLKDPQGGVKNTVPHGYGVYFSLLYLSLVGKLRWGESQIQFHKDMECILDCNYLLLKNSAGESQNTVSQGYGMYFRLKLSLIEKSTGESVKYRSTGICNVFQAVIISCRKLCWESVEYSSTGHRGMECISVYCMCQ